MAKKETVKELTNREEILQLINKEPDWFVGKYRNVWYAIQRHKMQYLCGYIGLPLAVTLNNTTLISPYTNECDLNMIDVHGGVTYHGNPTHFECPDSNLDWIGFDCNHSTDWSDTEYSREGTTYRTFIYVRDECKSVIDTYYKGLEWNIDAMKKAVGNPD